MSEGSTSKDTDILLLFVFLAVFFFILFKYVPQIVTYPWAAFMYVELTYMKYMLETLPQTPIPNIYESVFFVMSAVVAKYFIFSPDLVRAIKKRIKVDWFGRFVEGNFVYFSYCAFVVTTAVLIFFNTDEYYYDIASIWERLHEGSWKTLSYTNVFKVDFYLLPFNASVVIPALLYMASKYKLNPKSATRHDLESLILNLTTYFGFNRYLIKRNPLNGTKEINMKSGYHGVAFKSNEYLRMTGVLCDVIDNTGDVYCTFIDSRRLYVVLSYQIGPAFTTLEKLEEKHRWLAVCFLLIIIGQRTRSDNINYKIGYYYNGKEKPPERDLRLVSGLIRDLKFKVIPDYGRTEINRLVDAAIVDIVKDKRAQEILRQHGFVYSLISRLQREAGSKGKTPPNHYYWIYYEDRILGMVVCEQGKPGFSIEAYGANSIAENEYISRKPSRMPDISDVVKKLEKYLIEEFPVFLYQEESTGRIILEQESFKVREEGVMPEYGYWSLRYIKAPGDIPKSVIEKKLKYHQSWSEEMKRHALVAHFSEPEKGV